MPLLDKLREQYGVGPLCSELHIAPSTYYHCHTIDGQQGQAAPVRMRRGVIPELRCFREHAADSLTSQALAGLNNGTGGNEGAIARQHDVQAIHNLVKRLFTLKRHANNTPDHPFEGKTALA